MYVYKHVYKHKNMDMWNVAYKDFLSVYMLKFLNSMEGNTWSECREVDWPVSVMISILILKVFPKHTGAKSFVPWETFGGSVVFFFLRGLTL